MGFEENWRKIANNDDLKKNSKIPIIMKKPTKPHSSQSPLDWRDIANNSDVTAQKNKIKHEARGGDLNFNVIRDVFDGIETKPDNTIN